LILNQPFKGLRVLDFTHIYAGPFATYQLGILGAEIIKIEPPDSPDAMRDHGVEESANGEGLGSSYIFNNQGKKAVSINLSMEEGLKIAIKLVESADVLVENYSSGLAKLGLGPEDSMAVNPELIYCEMSGFGFGEDDRYAHRPAYDPVIQAFSGMMSLNGESDQPFLRVGPPLIDYGTGAQAAFAISAALFQRTQTGKGQHIQVNMVDAAMMMMSPQIGNAMQAGQTDKRTGNVQTNLPGYAVFPCKNGNIMLGIFTVKQHVKLFNLLALNQNPEVPDDIDKHWLAQNGDRIRHIILKKLETLDAAEWELFFNQHDIPAARIRDLYSMLETDQLGRAESSQFQRIENNPLTMPIAAFNYATGGPSLEMHCARHGEDTRDVLTDLGYANAELEELENTGAIYCQE
jgi:crotonobetainyl-CoA:carnitine CoA-transferase CaiB-like acyl-CoA transferase